MKIKKPRIVWMLDESLSQSKPNDWDQLTKLYQELIELTGKKEYNHVVTDPRPAFKKLSLQFKDKDYSTIIDLTGWSKSYFKTLFPNANYINDFGMTRIRDISSPELKTTGHLLNISQDRISQIKNYDLSKILIFDDTSISGGTAINTVKELDLEKITIDNAYLITNLGNLGKDNYGNDNLPGGAVGRLKREGHKVISGSTVWFGSEKGEDGWHLTDLHNIPNLEKVFYKSMELQEMYLDENLNKDKISSFLRDQENVQLLFPRSYHAKEIHNLVNEGYFRLNGSLPKKNTIHAANPTLWASKYLMNHIDIEKVINNKKEVVELLNELYNITPGYQKVKSEVDKVLSELAYNN